MNRRHFLSGLAASAAVASPAANLAQCVALPGGQLGCILAPDPAFRVVVQDCAERCWAASLSALFGYHGHPLNQNTIATLVRGPSCAAAGTSAVLSSVLTHTWTDDNGQQFTGTINGLYDPANGQMGLNNAGVIAALRAGNPLLYCNRTHCMVQLGMKFRQTAAGMLIGVDEVTVADPWPGNGIRTLSPTERMAVTAGPAGEMTYLASVTVS